MSDGIDGRLGAAREGQALPAAPLAQLPLYGGRRPETVRGPAHPNTSGVLSAPSTHSFHR